MPENNPGDFIPNRELASLVPVENQIIGIGPQIEKNTFDAELNRNFPHPIAGTLLNQLRENPDFVELFHEFNGQIVVDLGAGKTLTDYDIVRLANAKGYVAVEPYHAEALTEEFNKYAQYRPKIEAPYIPASIVKSDALSFLKRVPDHSVSVFSSGTNIEVIEDDEYREMVSQEIKRVLHPDGAFINHDSSFGWYKEGDPVDYRYKGQGKHTLGFPLRVFK
jgi:hypothetical protein